MAAEPIGWRACPICGGTARLSLMKTGLVCLTMNCCNAQLMTRSEKSDEGVRDFPVREKPTPKQRATAAAPAPAAPLTPEKTNAIAQAAAPKAQPAFSWGVLGGFRS